MSNLRPIQPGNLRPAPADLTPQLVERFLALGDQLRAHSNQSPMDASIAASGRTTGDFLPPIDAAEGGRPRSNVGGKVVSVEQKIIDVMRAAGGARWTIKSLARKAEVSADAARDAVQKMRWSGKMQFDRLELSPSMLADTAPPSVSQPAEPKSKGERHRVLAEAASAIEADRVFEMLVDEYLRPEMPSFNACYDRACQCAASEGIELPSRSTMRLRVLTEIDRRQEPRPHASKAIIGGAPARFQFKFDEQVVTPAPEALCEHGHTDRGSYCQQCPKPTSLEPTAGLVDLDAAKTARAEAQERIREEVAQEAAASVDRRRTAGFSATRAILDRKPANVTEQLATALVEDLDDALATAKRAWPDQWWRIVSRARARGVRPGVLFGEIVEAGLNVEAGR